MADVSSKEPDKGLETFIADETIIDRILQRKTKTELPARQVDLKEVLREILLKANEFVPSDSGSILLDDPLLKWGEGHKGKLYFMACFGVGSSGLAGTHLPDDVGIVGSTYRSGMLISAKTSRETTSSTTQSTRRPNTNRSRFSPCQSRSMTRSSVLSN